MSTAWLDAKASSGKNDNPSGPPTFSVPAHKLGMLVQYDYQVTDTDVEPCCKCCSWRQWYKDGKNKKGEDKWTEEKYCDSRGRPEGCVNRKCNCDTANEIWACNIADFPGPESETQRGDPFKSLVPYEQEFKSEVYLGTVHIGTVEWGYVITERHGEFDYTAKGKIKITCRDYSKK